MDTQLGTSGSVDLPQGSLRVYECGVGEPIVFVHGLFANAAAWRKVVPILAQSHRCITVDWPFGGHHRPMHAGADQTPSGIADTVADLIDAMNLDRVTLVGNDGGGMLAQLVVAQRPERIGRLVLTPCDAYENFPPPLFDYLCWAARISLAFRAFAKILSIRSVRHVAARTPLAFGRLTHGSVDAALIDHYLERSLADPAIRRDTVEFLRSVDKRYTLDAAQRFGRFAGPVLIAWAPEDRVFDFEYGQRLAAAFPDARLRELPDSLTWVAEDQPELLAALIDESMTRTSSTQG